MKARSGIVITEALVLSLLSILVTAYIELKSDNSIARVMLMENNETIKAECVAKNDIIVIIE